MSRLRGHIAAAVLTLAAIPAFAQAAPTAAAAAKHYSTGETTIGDLLADPAAKAIIDKHIPGLSQSDQIGMASGMTFRAIQPMAGDQITEKMLDEIDADFAKIPGK